MDLSSFLPWLVVLHVLSVLGFVALHGPSILAAFQLRNEHDAGRVRAILDQSGLSLGGMYGFLGLLVITGILAGIAGGYWTSGRLWIWAAVVVLVIVLVGMYVFATRHFLELRKASGSLTREDAQAGRTASGVADEPRLQQLLGSSAPLQAAVIGIVGLILLVWLMIQKPF